MTETRAEPFTPAERAVMAARAEAQAARLEAERMRREIVGYWKGEVAHADERAATFKAERDAALTACVEWCNREQLVEAERDEARAEAAEWRAEAARLRHKAEQYDDVVAALNVADGGRYRNDTEASVLTVMRAWATRAFEAEARLADLARQATAAGSVLEAAEAVADARDAYAEMRSRPWGDDEARNIQAQQGVALMALCSAVAALRAAREGVGK